MKAFILAAGRGERMRPLTDTCPKPLLRVKNKPLIVWHLEKLSQISHIDEIIINHAWLGEQIESTLGHGEQWGKTIRYSPEKNLGLETAGGIRYALDYLGPDPFLVINGDVFTDFNFIQLLNHFETFSAQKKEQWRATLVLVPNPPHHPHGDFLFQEQTYTFSGIGLYHTDLFRDLTYGQPAKLGALLKRQQMAHPHSIDFLVYPGQWYDIGTPERLNAMNQLL